MNDKIQQSLRDILKNCSVEQDIDFATPPDPTMGDFSYACFALAKKEGKNPPEVASVLAEEIGSKVDDFPVVDEVKAMGPYVNFFLNGSEVAKLVLGDVKDRGDTYGAHDTGKGQKVMIEFGCPNPLKVFHLGHLKNLITGESTVRVFENAGFEVIRVNYQGDVGMHQAKALWGILSKEDEIEQVSKASIDERVAWLGQCYAAGATAFEEDEKAKEDIVGFNKKIYEKDPEIYELYRTVRQWSLDYFDTIYQKLGSHFDKLYFESDVYESGTRLAKEALSKGILKESDGAVIFEGSKYGLHDRVFLNSQGFPTYEGKELGLAELHFADYHPNQVVHVVGKEQKGYFEVTFKALEEIVTESKGKETHLIGGYLQLKGGKKMSSRTGSVIAGDELLAMVEEKIAEIMKESEVGNKEETARKVTVAVLKYAMLKADVSQDVGFDMEESVSTSGDSGPYLLYIVARIKSILKKVNTAGGAEPPEHIAPEEKKLLLALATYPEATAAAHAELDPSIVAKYLFDLAQTFNGFYAKCPIVKAEEAEKEFRVQLIRAVEQVMTRGLWILGIETVEEM